MSDAKFEALFETCAAAFAPTLANDVVRAPLRRHLEFIYRRGVKDGRHQGEQAFRDYAINVLNASATADSPSSGVNPKSSEGN